MLGWFWIKLSCTSRVSKTSGGWKLWVPKWAFCKAPFIYFWKIVEIYISKKALTCISNRDQLPYYCMLAFLWEEEQNRIKNHFGNQPYHRQCTHHPPSIPLKSLSISNWKPLRHTHFHAQWRICWAISLSIIWYHDIGLVVEFGFGNFPWMFDDIKSCNHSKASFYAIIVS